MDVYATYVTQQNGMKQQQPQPNAHYATTMPLLQQTARVFVGPGQQKEAQLIGLGLRKLRSYEKDDLERAKRYAMDQSVKYVMLKQREAHQQQNGLHKCSPIALSIMSRVYIGSINFDIGEEHLRQVFAPYGPIKLINMCRDPSTGNHKGFAFVEYEVPEAAQLAQEHMNGKMMGGRTIKVSPVTRPQNMPQAQSIIDMIVAEARKFNRVYVASVHPDLLEHDLRSVFEAFGEIVKCQLAKDPSGKHRSFGYIEFKTAQAAKEAVEGMNGFNFGGQCLHHAEPKRQRFAGRRCDGCRRNHREDPGTGSCEDSPRLFKPFAVW
uniref:RRM domain-containing protein n=1 Tax=Globodera rostochiensis TaxID=31243 RepID=A0A914HWQ1_GLORO